MKRLASLDLLCLQIASNVTENTEAADITMQQWAFTLGNLIGLINRIPEMETQLYMRPEFVDRWNLRSDMIRLNGNTTRGYPSVDGSLITVDISVSPAFVFDVSDVLMEKSMVVFTEPDKQYGVSLSGLMANITELTWKHIRTDEHGEPIPTTVVPVISRSTVDTGNVIAPPPPTPDKPPRYKAEGNVIRPTFGKPK